MRSCQERIYSFSTIRKDSSVLPDVELVGFSKGDEELTISIEVDLKQRRFCGNCVKRA